MFLLLLSLFQHDNAFLKYFNPLSKITTYAYMSTQKLTTLCYHCAPFFCGQPSFMADNQIVTNDDLSFTPYCGQDIIMIKLCN